MSKIQIAAGVLLVSVLISAISQILLKKATMKQYKSILSEYLNPLVLFAYGLFFLSTLLTMFALRYVPLSMSPMLESTSYIFVSVLGYIFLKEKFSKRKLAGIFVIMLGIIVFSI